MLARCVSSRVSWRRCEASLLLFGLIMGKVVILGECKMFRFKSKVVGVQGEILREEWC